LTDPTIVDIGLFGLLAVVMIGPLLSSKIEHNLELFLFSIGVLAATVAWVWSEQLLLSAVLEPILKGIVPAVLIASLIFHYGKRYIQKGMERIQDKVPVKAIVFMIVVGLGLLSSIITAIIAALLLVELVQFLPLNRTNRVELVIIACFSIGLGAALTPMGEPLSTIAISKLQGDPFNADFFFLLRTLGIYIIPGIFFFGILGVIFVQGKRPKIMQIISLPKNYDPKTGGAGLLVNVMPKPLKCPWCKTKILHLSGDGLVKCTKCGKQFVHYHSKSKTTKPKAERQRPEALSDVFGRVLKVYVFVIALIFLGGGMKVLVDRYFTQVPAMGLYWVNMISAVLDNATLAASEVGPALSLMQVKATLMALLVSGGMLIPGNIPNIISSQKLKIKSKEWARVGIPLGLVLMLFYFVWLFFVPFP
jgi:predicted cation transporter